MDLTDLIGLYFVIQKVAGKDQVKVLTAGLGWALEAGSQNFNLAFSRQSLNNKV